MPAICQALLWALSIHQWTKQDSYSHGVETDLLIVSRAVVGVLFPIMMEKREFQCGFIIIEAILESIMSQGRN